MSRSISEISTGTYITAVNRYRWSRCHIILSSHVRRHKEKNNNILREVLGYSESRGSTVPLDVLDSLGFIESNENQNWGLYELVTSTYNSTR